MKIKNKNSSEALFYKAFELYYIKTNCKSVEGKSCSKKVWES